MQAIPHYLCLEVAIYFLSLPLGWPCPSLKLPLFSRSRKKKERTTDGGNVVGDEKEKRIEWQIVHKSNLLGIFQTLVVSPLHF